MKHALMTTAGMLLLGGTAAAQQTAPALLPAVPPAVTARLQQMESIYQKGLSARHIPLLGKYLIELQRQAALLLNRLLASRFPPALLSPGRCMGPEPPQPK